MEARTAGAALLALAIVTAGVLAGTAPTADAATDGTGPTIDVAATGTTEVAPDEAVVRVAVVATGDDPESVRDELADGAAALREALAEAGVEDVTTAGYSLGPDYRTPEDEPERYRGVHAFTVTVAPDAVGPVVDAAAGSGATVQGVRFVLSEDARREARADALAEAMGEARAQADVVAGEASLAVEGVHSASTSDVRHVPYDARTEAGGAADSPTVVEPGPVTVTATVQVTYDAA